MKIGVVSRGRTHSTAIVQSLSAKLNVPNYREIYRTIPDLIKKDYRLIRQRSIELEFLRFKSDVLKITDRCFSQPSFITKIWPSMLIYHLSYQMPVDKTFDMIKKHTLFNIKEYLKIDQYDKLYFIDRNLETSTASWVYAYKNQLYHFGKNGGEPYRPTITITQKDFDTARFYILEYCLQQKLKTFLQDNNIIFEDITDNCFEFINNNMVTIRQTNNDYQSLITNYDELQSFITDWYPICLEDTKDWHYT